MRNEWMQILVVGILFFALMTLIVLGAIDIKNQNASAAKRHADLAEYKTRCGLAGGIAVKFENTYMCMDPSATIELE